MAGGHPMLMHAIDTYLALRRAAGFRLRATEHYLRYFARFMRTEDPGHELPPEQVFCGNHRRPTPYIFTDDELERVLVHTRRLKPSRSLRPHTYSTLFTLLAVTGLRPSEALAL